MKKTADNASNNLRKSISDLGAHYNDYAGNKNLRNWAVFRIKGNTQRLRSLQRGLISSKRLIDFIKTGLGRVVFPLIGIIVAWELKLVFPLAENLTVNQLVDVGLFIQIMQAYMSTWRESVVYLDKQQDLSDANSGFSNMQDLCDIYKVSPKELRTFIDEKSMPSTMSLHIKQALLCFQPAFLTLGILSLSQVAILPLWLSQSLLLPWLAVTISLTATYIITSQKNSQRFDQNIDLNIFSMLSSFIGTSILLGLCRLFSQSIPFLTQITPLQLTVVGLGFFLVSSHLVLSLALSSHRQLLTSANSSVEPDSLKKSYPSFSKTTAPNPSSKPIIESAPISYESVKDLNHIKAENLALSVPEKNTLTKKWELNGEMVFEARQSNLIIAPNSTGKSSTIRALCEDSQRSQEFFHGTVTLPENHQMFCFHQQNNPLGRLPRFDEKATLHLPTTTVELKPLQLLFLRYVLSDFQNPSQADQWIWKNWDSIREQIVNFLKDKELDFGNLTNDISHGKSSENTWIKLLEKDEIDVGMSGGAVAKLHAAIIYAMLDVYSQLESQHSHKGYKAPFLSVIIDEGFNDVATDNLSALLKKLTTKIKNCPKSTLICILHTDRKDIVQLYDKITLLQSSSTQKSTPHTQSECKQFYTSDEMGSQLDTFHTERVTPCRF